MNQPLVSVIIPTYKRSEMLYRAVDSVLNQTYQNIQVIVVDDNSPDSEWRAATSEKMRRYESDSRVKYVCHEQNRNGSVARNTGIHNSDGEIVAFLDDDDWFLPEKVELQVEYLLTHPEFRAVYCGWDRDNRKIIPTKEGDLSFEILSGRNIIITNTIMMWRSDAIACGGWDEELRRHQEAGFLLRYFAHGGKIGVVSRILTEFDISDRSNAAPNSAAFEKNQFFYLDRYQDRIEACEAERKGAKKDIYSYRYRGVLLNHLRGRNFGLAWKTYMTMMKQMPVKFNLDFITYFLDRGRGGPAAPGHIYFNELLFVLYYFASLLVRPLAVAVPVLSRPLLIISTVLIMLAWIYINGRELRKGPVLRLGVLLLLIGGAMGCDLIFRPNEYISGYAYQFLIHGAIPLVLLTSVDDYRRLMQYWSMMAIAMGVLFALDPLLRYPWTENYMIYGLNVAIPAFLGSILLWTYFKKRWAAVSAAAFFVAVVIFANKSAIIVAAAILAAGYCYFTNHSVIQKKRLTAIGLSAVAAVVLCSPILKLAIAVLGALRIDSYALESLDRMVHGKISFLGNRLVIWDNAWGMVQKHPWIGNGIGGYEALHNGNYIHNIFLDAACSWGIPGMIIFIAVLCVTVWMVLRTKDADKRTFEVSMLIIWLIPMLLSLSLWAVMPFWVYFGSVLVNCAARRGKLTN